MRAVGGVFVGGASRRMGVAKGLLASPDGTPLVERTGRLFDALGIPWVLVGAREEYAHLGRLALTDDVPDAGPLGGLVALLEHAGTARAIAIACDMPRVSTALLARLAGAPEGPPIVAPRRGGRWEPMFARFDAPAVLPAARRRCASGARSLQALFDEVGAAELTVSPSEAAELDDWDTPDDVARDARGR